MNNFESTSSWRGVPLTDICGATSPWAVPEFPLISPAYNHTVLYHISNDQLDRPPKPQPGHDIWNHDFVRMPHSDQSLYPVTDDDGHSTLEKRWNIIEKALKKPIRDSEDLANAILSYNTKFISVWKFNALHKLFNDCLEEEETEYFFNVTINEIAKLALALPKLIQSPIPLLKQHRNRTISLSQQQISSLLANAFFCTFPRRNTRKKDSEYSSYPYINFNTLYESSASNVVIEKLKCICHYFRRVTTKVPIGVMTFIRHTVPPDECPRWSESTKFVGGTPLHVDSEGIIEDADGLIQVDFANKFLGGGVLNRGCVQEEIRFVICPELLISMLFTEVLDSTEALLMIGCERYSKYTGYGDTFEWGGHYEDTTPHDSSRRRRCAVLAIDATPFRRESLQYESEYIVRELNKAWVGVSCCAAAGAAGAAGAARAAGVASGNWGCGAFGGSAHLKSLLQLMACAEARRALAYYTFGDVPLRNDIVNVYNLLSKCNVTVGQLYNYLIQFKPKHDKTSHPSIQLYGFLYQLLIDEEICEPEKNNMETSRESLEFSRSFSKDLFEDDELLVDATLDKLESQNPAVNLNEEKRVEKGESLNRNVNKTSTTLFDEMTSFDADNGQLNLSSSNHSIFNTPSHNTSYESKEHSKKEDSIERKQSISKKKIGKKITDYFNKKSN